MATTSHYLWGGGVVGWLQTLLQPMRQPPRYPGVHSMTGVWGCLSVPCMADVPMTHESKAPGVPCMAEPGAGSMWLMPVHVSWQSMPERASHGRHVEMCRTCHAWLHIFPRHGGQGRRHTEDAQTLCQGCSWSYSYGRGIVSPPRGLSQHHGGAYMIG